MGSAKDKISGLVKETTGDVTDNDKLRREGQAEQAKGDLKHKADSLNHHAQDAVNKGVNRVSDAVHRRT